MNPHLVSIIIIVIVVVVIIIIIIIIITTGKATIFESYTSSQDSPKFRPVFISLHFLTINFYRARSSALRPTPQPAGPGLCIYVPPVTGWPGFTPTHLVSFSSSPTTFSAAMEILVFKPTPTRDLFNILFNIMLKYGKT
jgi:hypothetical protein